MCEWSVCVYVCLCVSPHQDLTYRSPNHSHTTTATKHTTERKGRDQKSVYIGRRPEAQAQVSRHCHAPLCNQPSVVYMICGREEEKVTWARWMFYLYCYWSECRLLLLVLLALLLLWVVVVLLVVLLLCVCVCIRPVHN